MPPAVAEKRGAALKTLLAGHFAAVRHLRDNPTEAARHMTVRQRMEPEAILKSLEGIHIHSLAENQALLSGAPAHIVRDAREVGRAMIEYGLLPAEADLDRLTANLADPRWLPATPP